MKVNQVFTCALQVHYHRISDKRNTEEHVERTVMFLPSIWDCQPSQDDWDILKNPVYKRESPTPSASPTTPSSTAASLTEPSPTIPPTTSVKQEVLVDVACSDIVDEGLEFSNISQQNVRRCSDPPLPPPFIVTSPPSAPVYSDLPPSAPVYSDFRPRL